MSGWKNVKLSQVCTIEKGTTGIQKSTPGEYPLVVTSEERKTHNTFQFDAEAVIVPIVSSTGHGHASIKRIHFQKGKFALGTILCAIIPKNKKELNAEYLYLFLDLNKEKELVGRMKGMANVTLPIKEIANIEIPLPPIDIQEMIIKKLSGQLSKARIIKQLYEISLEASEHLLPSILGRILSEGIVDGWAEKTIDEVSKNIQYGYTASAKKEGNAKLLRITDIQKGFVNWGTVPSCNCADLDKYRLHTGDIVFARTGATVGKSFLITEPPTNAIFASYLIRLQVREDILPEYIYYFFQSSLYWDQISNRKAGAAQPNVNGTKLKKLKIPVPPVNEQRKLVARLDSLSKKIELLIKSQSEGRLILDALEPSFFGEAFVSNTTHV